ncbi:hypothetical protein CNMCM7691_003009 [Aspergillus felis]|uniref:Xylanolytic transcriptional activator regulatory domain-containing protein n=1 Tax=Aspergillus felis TaxID=1287682 RepID=A0A8H6R125_9EURO|nr:hypothetical protein CNMCM7691_003009 [Aspergillus felis]
MDMADSYEDFPLIDPESLALWMASSEVDQKALGNFAAITSLEHPFLSAMLYRVLGLSVMLSKKLLRARRLRRLDPTRETKSLQLYHHIIWLSREGLLILEEFVLPMVEPYVELKILAYKLRASFYHIFVLFHNEPPVHSPGLMSLRSHSSATNNAAEAESSPKDQGSRFSFISKPEVIPFPQDASSNPKDAARRRVTQAPPGLAPVQPPKPASSFLLPSIDYTPTATACFNHAALLAERFLPGSHPLRLSIKLEYAAYIYDCLHDPNACRRLAKQAIADVYNAQEGMDDESFQDAAEIVRILGKMVKRAGKNNSTGPSSTSAGTPRGDISMSEGSLTPKMRSGIQKPGAIPFLALILFSILSLVPSLAKEWGFYNLQIGYLAYSRNEDWHLPRVKDGAIEVRPRASSNGALCKSWLAGGSFQSCPDRKGRPRRGALDAPSLSAFEAASVFDSDPMTQTATRSLSLTRGVHAFKTFFIKQLDDYQILQPFSPGSAPSVPTATSRPVPPPVNSSVASVPFISEEIQHWYRITNQTTSATKHILESSRIRFLSGCHNAWQQACLVATVFLKSFPSTIATQPLSSNSSDSGFPLQLPGQEPVRKSIPQPLPADALAAPAKPIIQAVPAAGQSDVAAVDDSPKKMRGSCMAIVIGLVVGYVDDAARQACRMNAPTDRRTCLLRTAHHGRRSRSLLPQQLKRLGSLPSPSLSAPLVVIRSAAPPSSTWNGRESSPRRTLQSSREAGPRRRYTLGLFSHRRTQSGSAMYAARGQLQARGQIDFDEGSVGGSDEKSDAIEVSSQSDESFHTATRSPMPELVWGESRGAQEGSHFARIRQAQERRTGSVKREEEELIEDRLPRLRHSNLAGGTLISALDEVDEEMMDSPVDLSRDDADRLVNVYLNLDYVSLPILDIQDFRAAYEAASGAGDSTTLNAFYAILNTIFALACLSVDDMGDERARYFFKEGQKLANQFDQYKSIDFLRLCLLQVQYLNAIGDLHTAWAVIGSTIRLAQSLHLPSHAKQHGQSRKGRETCRRLWHGAMIMERILALRLGIAPQTPDPLRVPLPTHLDTDYVDVISSAQPSAPSTGQGERASIIEFFTACARLYRLVEDVMAWEEEARIRPHGCAMKKLLSLDFTRFLKADSLLHDWNLSLPSSLQSSGLHGLDEHSIVIRQRNILRARYLYLRLRLNRPLVTLGLALTTACKCKSDGQPHIVKRRLAPDSPVALSLVHGASIKCVRAALELTELIRANEAGLLRLDTPSNASHCLSPPYWESVDYLYVCGTVFLASFNHHCPFFGDMTDEEDEQCKVLWPCIMDLLDRYQGYRRRGRTNNVAQACRRTFGELAKAVQGTDGTGWTVDSAVLGQEARARFSQRTEMESPIRHRRISGASQTIQDPVGNVPEFPVWMDSLPVDLVG